MSEARVIAVVVALGAFVVAVAAGLAADNPASTVLLRALAAMIAAQFVGWGAGEVLAYVRRTHTTDYIRRNPVPVVNAASAEPVVEVGGETVENSVKA